LERSVERRWAMTCSRGPPLGPNPDLNVTEQRAMMVNESLARTEVRYSPLINTDTRITMIGVHPICWSLVLSTHWLRTWVGFRDRLWISNPRSCLNSLGNLVDPPSPG
jgi:hypothetical protein